MKDLALLTLHGMGEHKPRYYAELEDELRSRLGDDWARISFQPIQYAPILQGPQTKLWQDMVATRGNDLDATKLRRFLLYGFGDAGSLEHSAHRDHRKYLAVEREILSALQKAFIDLDRDSGKPVVIMAQSLGCQVISNYLWDVDTEQYLFEDTSGIDPDELEFVRLRSLTNLITTGCNIPLFISGLEERKCFKKPSKNFRWDNFYDPDDILGWPLAQLGPDFERIKDHDINAGGVFSSWNPLSHTNYWGDGDVLRPVAEMLRRLLM